MFLRGARSFGHISINVKLVDGILAGTHSKVGYIVRLTDAQAKYPLLYGWVKLR